MMLPITIVAKASRIIAPMGHVNLGFAFLLFSICVVTNKFTIVNDTVRIILGTSLYKKSMKIQEKLKFFLYFLLNVILWTIYRIWGTSVCSFLYCLVGIILPTYFFILNILYMAEHLEENAHLSPETISAYDKRLDKLGLSNYRWVIGGDEDISPSNKPSLGSSGAPEGGPKKPDDSWWAKFVKI
jgi:hypothetical protein